jgi:MerR family mercuric resistance operon transcriptional regulator
MEKLTIGRLAQLGGVNLETVRYYERRGLLPKPPRTEAGYRQFPVDSARRLRFIKRAQELGFSLEEVRDLLALCLEPKKNKSHVRSQAKAKIIDIDRKIAALAAIKATLQDLASRCEHCGASTDCPILASLDEGAE